jgi:hypothetical protein
MMYPQSNRADRSNLAVDSDDLEFCRAKTLETIPLHRRFHGGCAIDDPRYDCWIVKLSTRGRGSSDRTHKSAEKCVSINLFTL